MSTVPHKKTVPGGVLAEGFLSEREFAAAIGKCQHTVHGSMK